MNFPEFIAHRGANQLFPENTMASFKKALNLGCNWIEMDVQLSKDNIPFIFHDHNAKRLTGVNKDLTECNFNDIAPLSVLDGKFSKTEKYTIPALKEYLDWMLGEPGLYTNIEIKTKITSDPEYEKHLAQQIIFLLQEYPSLHSRIVLSSFSQRIIKTVVASFTQKTSMALAWLVYIDNWQQAADKLSAIIQKFNQYKCVALGINANVLINKQRVDWLKAKFPRILAYSMNILAIDGAKKLLDHGVDSVFIDDVRLQQKRVATIIGFLGTGDEITTGDILNTNTPALAREIYALGFAIGSHLICGDNQDAIESSVNFLLSEHNVVMTVGGLGPTEDDKTMAAVSSFGKCTLIFNEESWQRICQRIAKRFSVVSENNKKQAYFPQGAKILINQHGTADGCYLRFKNNKHLFVLPGPPHECMAMFHSFVVPVLKDLGGCKKRQIYYWQLLGASESEVSSQLQPLALEYGENLGYRATWPYLEIKLHSDSPKDKLTALINKIDVIIAPFIATATRETASQSLKKRLAMGDVEIMIQKDVTKGYICSHLLQLLPQHIKNPRFRITLSTEGMLQFWQKNKAVIDDITVKINFTDHQNKRCIEKTRKTQFITKGKNSFVFAYEWVCATMLMIVEKEVGKIE